MNNNIETTLLASMLPCPICVTDTYGNYIWGNLSFNNLVDSLLINGCSESVEFGAEKNFVARCLVSNNLFRLNNSAEKVESEVVLNEDMSLIDQRRFLVISDYWNNGSSKSMSVINTLSEITAYKVTSELEQKPQIQEKYTRVSLQLEKNLSLIPTALYWKDKDSRFLGANKVALEYMGINSIAEYIGKDDYELWPKDLA